MKAENRDWKGRDKFAPRSRNTDRGFLSNCVDLRITNDSKFRQKLRIFSPGSLCQVTKNEGGWISSRKENYEWQLIQFEIVMVLKQNLEFVTILQNEQVVKVHSGTFVNCMRKM